MKKRRSIRLINAGDILLTVICLIGMAVAIYLFWEDLNVSLSKQDEAPVAVVYFKKNTVQRRFVDRNLWERVQESALVYDGDRIRTSDMSEAVTVFADGTEIEIHENTLIQLYKQKDRAAIDFVSGAITATAAGFEGEETEAAPLLIKTGDKVVELDSGSAASVAAPVSSAKAAGTAAAKTETVAVTVTKGTAAVREAKKEDAFVEKAAAKSVANAARNSIADLGTAAREVISTVSTAAVPAAPVEEAVTEKQVLQTGEVSLVKTVEPEPSENVGLDAVQAAEPEREATLFLPLSSTTVRLEEDILPLIRMQWTSNTDLTFEFARDASFTKSLFTRTYPAYQEQAYVSFEDYTELGSVFWRSYFAGDPESVFATGIVLFEQLPDESVQEMIDRVLNDEDQVPVKDEPDTQEEAIKAEAIRKEEEERKAREEAARLDAEKARRAEEERLAAERRAEEERLEAERRAEEERLEAERRAEQERLEAERRAAEEARQKKLEEERIAAEKAATERRLAEARAAEEKRLAEQKRLEEERAAREEQERLAREEAERQRLEEEARKAEAQRLLEEERARIEAEKVAQLEAARKTFAASSPTLRDPYDGKVLDDSFFDTNRSLQFSWSPLTDASSYRLVIKQKGLLSKTIVERSVNGTSYTMRDLSGLDEGEFEWTVTGKMADGTQSKAASGSFSVHLEPLEDIELDTSGLFHR